MSDTSTLRPDFCRTLYDKLGGAAAIEAAVSVFYSRILGDPLLAPFFEGVCMKTMAKKQVMFLSYAFGGLPGVSGATTAQLTGHNSTQQQCRPVSADILLHSLQVL
jgi:hemoglobin